MFLLFCFPKNFFVSFLVFRILTSIGLSINFFEFILFGGSLNSNLVALCLLSNLRSFQPLFLCIFFHIPPLFVSFWNFSDMSIRCLVFGYSLTDRWSVSFFSSLFFLYWSGWVIFFFFLSLPPFLLSSIFPLCLIHSAIGGFNFSYYIFQF